MSTAAVTPSQDEWAQYAETPTQHDEWAQYAEKPSAQAAPEEKSPEPSFLNTLGREGRSAYQSIVGIPGAVYHAFSDAPTPEEQKEFSTDAHPGLIKRGAIGLTRMTAEPIADAAVWYTRAAQGKIPNAYEQALSVAPEAFGQGAGNVIAAKGVDSAIDTAQNMTATKATAPVRAAVRTANTSLEKAPELVGGAAGAAVGKELGHPVLGATAGAALGRRFLPKIRIPGENFGLPDRVTGGPAVAPQYVEPQPVYPGATLPEHPGVFPGAPLPATPAPEVLNPSLVSEARSLPGQIAPEVVRPRMTPAAPIPSRSGLALPPAPETAAEAPVESAAPPVESEATPRTLRTRPDREPNGPGNIQNVPDVSNGESALRQVLTGQDNATLLKIAKSRGINVSKESQLKPAAADKLLVNKIVEDFSPEELEAHYGDYVENSRFRHGFGDIGPEAQKTLSLQTFFPDVKIPAARMIRTRTAITNAPLRNEVPATAPTGEFAAAMKENARTARATSKPAAPAAPSEDLTDEWQRNNEFLKARKNKR